jgi:hypothetical protein
VIGIVPLSGVQSLYECGAEVIITHVPDTGCACVSHAQLVEKSITSLVPRLCEYFHISRSWNAKFKIMGWGTARVDEDLKIFAVLLWLSADH